MSDNNSDFGAFLAGFVIGGLVGAATALILAPQSGHEMRSQLAERSHDWRQAGGERFQHVRETAVSYANDYTTKAQELGGQVQQQARIVLDSSKEQAAKMREQVASRMQQAEETEETETTETKNLSDSDAPETP
ncbi:MAG: YtxH domain-containing protein [Ardenticatenaceae bacterium]|nr:YtxH domain-containing protein [Anaerolineales bacterium]MCB8920631.1 YtxH domain-containing protein [Ardenticatenaceae bacterium]MCB8990255.1 YtxH domain-containing protein [Ardenticatenaceae bacterium]MCB9002953.1 YtxH domain-containing protein [Ardenticatenaceae bacterium]